VCGASSSQIAYHLGLGSVDEIASPTSTSPHDESSDLTDEAFEGRKKLGETLRGERISLKRKEDQII
jgi:hypothetical protein